MTRAPGTRTRLIETAARLFRRKGYAAVGVAEILAEAGVPKGSLYHHFPKGKADLAEAAVDWASQGMITIIDDSFGPATCFDEGQATLCHKLAKFFDISAHTDGCPVTSILLQADGAEPFLDLSAKVFDGWIAAIAAHGQRLGLTPDGARACAETLLMALEGGWILARARRDAGILRSIPARLSAGSAD